MIKIYFKEAKESYDSVFDVLSHYFSIAGLMGGNRNPATYWEDSNEIQCTQGRNRSFDDLLLLSQYYIKDAKIEDVVRALYQYNKDKTDDMLACIHCSTIKRFVITSSRYNQSTIVGASYVYLLFPPSEHPLSERYGLNSQWTLDELKAMVND
jgi:hypothetical protein